MKQNQNKFLRIISTPLRALGKARDLYVRSMTGCAAKTHYSSAASASFPRSRSTSSAAFSSSASSRRTTDFGIDEDYSELVRAASVRSLGHKSEIDMLIQEKLQQQKQQRQGGGLPKSSSVGMARIEEDEEAEEGSVNPKMKKAKKVSDLLYPRSKSYAVTSSPKL
ncbi:PREDICTED: uncharacterized protein LOC104755225 [Camelina sativa]|uniref:Uncharacterized protein LOC104755225 n=1 Tax=Camelina sativa TaxID=90675 RepID=A0ABM0WTC8_CAMSA|nr:PREDICTED: uncharacterized protein LOC104755225 [Camelina sativa]